MDSSLIRQAIIIILVIIFLPIILKKFFSPPGVHKKYTEDDSIKSVSAKKGVWSFVAMKYYFLILNRTYRIYVTDNAICGIRVGNTISSPPNPISPEWQEPDFYADKNLEKKYHESDFQSSNFLLKDKSNFLVNRDDIIRIDIHPKKWGMGQVPYSGRLVIVTKRGNVELILLGKQDSEEIKQKILNY